MKEMLKPTEGSLESKQCCSEYEENNIFDVFKYELIWLDNLEITIRITKYKAKIRELNVVDLIPNGCNDSDRFVMEVDFDKVHYYNLSDIFCIYTKDKSIENKKLCIEKLVKYANQFYWKKENALRDKRTELARTYDQNKFIIKDDSC